MEWEDVLPAKPVEFRERGRWKDIEHGGNLVVTSI